MRKPRTTTTAIALFAGLALAGSTATVAQAAAGPAQSVPSCVTTTVYPTVGAYRVEMTNTCGDTHSVTPVFTNTDPGDLPCYTLSPGEQARHQSLAWNGSFVALAAC